MALIVSQGSGATIATDIIASNHYSFSKIVNGTAGSSTAWIVGSDGSGQVSLKGNVTLTDAKTYIGLTTTTIANSMVTVTLGTKLDSTNDSVDIKSGATVTINSAATIFAVVNTQAAGQASVVVDGPVAIKGNVTLSDSKTFIGLTTVTGSALDIRSLNSTTTLFAVVNTQAAGQASVVIDGPVAVTNAGITTLAGTVYAEDAPHASTNPGVFMLAVRNSGNAVLTSLDGDYSPLNVDDTGSPQIVIKSGQSKVTGNISSEDPDSGEPIKVGGKYNLTLPTFTDLDRGDLQISSRGRLIVDGSGVTQPVSLASTIVTGNVAHDAVDSGDPIKIGGKALTAAPTPVTANDRVNAWFTEYGQLVTSDYDVEVGAAIGSTGLRDRLMAQRYTVLADTLADGLAGFWTSTVANGGTTTSTDGEGQVATSANALGSAQLTSTTQTYFPGQVGWFNSAVRFNDTGSAGNIRRIGVFTVSGTTPQEGFYYELSGTTLNAVVNKAATPTAVASASWSRATEAPFTLDTNYHSFEIRFTANTVWFYVDNVLRHKVSGTTASITSTLNFPMTIQSINTSGATNRLIAVRNCGIGRFGDPSQPVDETGLSAIRAIGVGGGTPHDSVDSGNPLKLGGYAKTTAPTSVADGDRVNAWFSPAGALNIADGAGSLTIDGSLTAVTDITNPVALKGNVTLSDAKTYVGLTTTTLGIGTTFIGLVTANSRNAGTTKTLFSNFIGLGNNSIATIAVPTNANCIKVTNILLSSNVTTEVAIKSGVTYLTGNASLGITLFPGGGFEIPGSPDSPSWCGLPSGALVIEKRDVGIVSKIGGGLIYFEEAQ